MFGSHNIGVSYGIVLTAWSIAGTGGGLLFTAIFNHQIISLGWTTGDAYPYIVNSYWILSLVVVGLLCTILVRTELKDRLLPPLEGQCFRFRLFRHMLVIKRVGICPVLKIIGSEEYDEMWEKYLKTLNLSTEKVEENGSKNYGGTELTTLVESTK